jgi:pimeloyl-ACP methyl ester carboxylesterase
MLLTVDGARVFAATGGRAFDTGQPAILFVHGAGMDRTVWSLQARYLAHHGRSVLAVDLPGHGRSEGPALASIEAMAAWLLGAVKAAGLERCSLVGHSMGAFVALAAAALSPGSVERLALIGIAAAMPVHPDLLAAARAGDPKAWALMVDWGHGREGRIGGNPAPGLWRVGGGYRLLQRGGPGVLAADLAASAAYEGAVAAAAMIRCPVLMILGAEDRMTPPDKAAPLGQAMGDVRTILLPRCGHMLMAERPNEVVDALAGFL